jgi:hypothetical protein
VAPLPFNTRGFFETNQERNATQVNTRHSLTFALWVSLLLVRYAFKFAFASLGRLQQMQLPAMQARRHYVPEPGTAGVLCSTDRGGQHPRVTAWTSSTTASVKGKTFFSWATMRALACLKSWRALAGVQGIKARPVVSMTGTRMERISFHPVRAGVI